MRGAVPHLPNARVAKKTAELPLVCCLTNRQLRFFYLFELDCFLKIIKEALLGRTHCLTTKTQESPFS